MSDQTSSDEEEEEEEEDWTHQELGETIEKQHSLLPIKSRQRYESVYRIFVRWKNEREVHVITEDVLLSYFRELAEKYKPPTLWATYSMLRSTININDKVNVDNFKQLTSFLKRNSTGYKGKKSKIFTAKDMKTFLDTAPNDQYLVTKVVLIFGVYGACRSAHLTKLTVDDVRKCDNIMVIKLRDTKTRTTRNFIVEGECLNTVTAYQALRPENTTSDRFFLNYRNGRCTNQVIGKNKLGRMPKEIATFLNLPDPEHYTGHSFRRSSASLVVDIGENQFSNRGVVLSHNITPAEQHYGHSLSANTVLLLPHNITQAEQHDEMPQTRIGIAVECSPQPYIKQEPQSPTSHTPQNAADSGTQTDFSDVTSRENVRDVLFCSQDSSRNLASTQTMITYNIVKEEKDLDPMDVPKSGRVASNGQDDYMKLGLPGFEDVKDDSTLQRLCGSSVSFFETLLNCIPRNIPGEQRDCKKLSRESNLLMFLMKMKLGLSFEALGCIFTVSELTASNVFFGVLESLFLKTHTWITWPSKRAIRKMAPAEFSNYPNLRAIMNFIELRCDEPPKVEQQIWMYSNLKGWFTTKYLVAISPSGMITFTSKGYGGRSTDECITNDSGFLNLVDSEDEIMADRDYPLIRSELLKRHCTLVTPPFDHQYNKEGDWEGHSIASARIYAEGAIQRIRAYRIFEHVNVELFPYIDKLMFIACILVNNDNSRD